MIFYKDQKSAQRVRQYETPLGAIELRGGKVSWVEGDKKRKHAIEVSTHNKHNAKTEFSHTDSAIRWRSLSVELG